MISDRAAALISAFDAAEEGKLDLVREIEDFPEREVTEFFARVASDPGEYDLARIEAIRVLQVRVFDDDSLRASVAKALQRVLSDDEDDLVRAYAATALANFTKVPGVITVAGALVLDEDEDEDVRHNAFFALERGGPTEESVDLMTRALADPEFAVGAKRVLTQWGR